MTYWKENLVSENENETTVTISLGDDATYDVYAQLFSVLAGRLRWEKAERGGWNITLNDEDVNVLKVDDDGITVRPPLNDEWDAFGVTKFVPWDNVFTIVVL